MISIENKLMVVVEADQPRVGVWMFLMWDNWSSLYPRWSRAHRISTNLPPWPTPGNRAIHRL